MTQKRPIVDVHTHVFPQALDPWLEKISVGPLARIPSRRWIDRKRTQLREAGRKWMGPLAKTFHRIQPITRVLPKAVRYGLDELGGAIALPHLLVESTPSDLGQAMESTTIGHALIIAHPPYADNEFILREAIKNPKLLPVVYIPKECPAEEAASELRRLAERGARALKIHPASDGEGPESPRYLALLEEAQTLKLPVIVHTGCFHLSFLYKDLKNSGAELYEPWFKGFPQLRFILAHMNYHDPRVAIELGERYSNVYVDTSWQPAETISEAVRRMGADRVLFGSDWPLGGKNIEIGLERIQECIDMGWIREDEADKIRGESAARLFELSGGTHGS